MSHSPPVAPSAPVPGGQPGDQAPEIRGYPRVAVTIAGIQLTGTIGDFMWYPFLPLLALDLARGNQAAALYWVSAAWILMGCFRVFAGPVWGYIADRVGRKPMYVRSLIFGLVAPAMTVWLNEPWQLVFVMAVLGLLTGNMAASASLTSVSVPPSRLGKSLALVTGAQFLGMTLGPALGGLLIPAGGYSLTVFVAVCIVAICPIATMLLVPADIVRVKGAPAAPLERLRPTAQLWLILLIQMVLFAVNYTLTIVSPVMLNQLAPGRATELTGVAFACAGLASAAGILLLSGRMFRPGRLGLGLVVCSAGGGLTLFMLAFSDSVVLYIAGFSLVSLLMAAMNPAVNALTALNVPATRRGTGFGLVTSAQAAAFILGPSAAALFAATSFSAGFVAVGLVFLALAALVWRALREPAIERAQGG